MPGLGVSLALFLAVLGLAGLSRREFDRRGLEHPSVTNVSQMGVVDRRRLVEKVGEIPAALLREVDEGMKLILGLS